MQKRHTNRKLYFNELAETSKNYYIPLVEKYIHLGPSTKVLEIGCGEGGNLVPFANLGCQTFGIDIAEWKINEAKFFFEENNLNGDFKIMDICTSKINEIFDVIICHDVYEHIFDKDLLLFKANQLLCESGIFFISFPSWFMPFGGHQQICRNKILCHFPFLHLLSKNTYRFLLRIGHESDETINELFDIRETKAFIKPFEKKAIRNRFSIIEKTLYLVSPHYKIKFGLKPRILISPFNRLPLIRDFLTSSCFYILKKNSL